MKRQLFILLACFLAGNICYAQSLKDAEAYFTRGSAKDSMQDYTGALADQDTAIALNPKCAAAYAARAFTRSKLEDNAGAIADCKTAIAIDPEYAISYNNLGTVMLDMKDYKNAAIYFIQSTDRDPAFAPAWFNRSLTFYYLEKTDEAAKAFIMLRLLNPGFQQIGDLKKMLCEKYIKTGWEQYGKKGLYPQAAVEYKKALAIDPTNDEVWYNIGGACYKEKKYLEAERAFKVALRLNPDNAAAKEGLDAVLPETGK